MASVITIAGEQLFAAKAQANEQLDIDTFIFANVPNQDPSAPINREEGIPTAHIVYQQNVQQVGRINDNVVVYSTVLDSITGPFEFNWVGLYSSVNQKLVAINHVPTVTKTATAPGAAGNTLNRNFGIEYSGIAELTGISVEPETWQLDFTARLSGMDKLTQQLATDMNGKDWFIEDGLKVVPRATANSFSVTPGVGYVSGLRVELKQEHILIVQNYQQFVYVDAWFSGNANSTWSPQLAFTVTNTEMDDYIDPSGTQHYVYKLAVINAADDVEDLRVNSKLLTDLDNLYDHKFSSVQEMKSSSKYMASLLDKEDLLVKTKSYFNSVFSMVLLGGGSEYVLTTLSRARNSKKLPDWEPDGFGDHYLNYGDGKTYVAILQVKNNTLDIQSFGANDGISGDSAKVQAAVEYALPNQIIEFSQSNKNYIIDTPVLVTKPLTFKGGCGNKQIDNQSTIYTDTVNILVNNGNVGFVCGYRDGLHDTGMPSNAYDSGKVVWENLQIGPVARPALNTVAIQVNSDHNYEIKNCLFRYLDVGVDVTGAYGADIHNNMFIGNRLGVISHPDYANGFGNPVDGVKGGGVAGWETNDISIHHNTFSGTSDFHVYFNGFGHGLTVNNNSFEQSAAGIYVSGYTGSKESMTVKTWFTFLEFANYYENIPIPLNIGDKSGTGGNVVGVNVGVGSYLNAKDDMNKYPFCRVNKVTNFTYKSPTFYGLSAKFTNYDELIFPVGAVISGKIDIDLQYQYSGQFNIGDATKQQDRKISNLGRVTNPVKVYVNPNAAGAVGRFDTNAGGGFLITDFNAGTSLMPFKSLNDVTDWIARTPIGNNVSLVAKKIEIDITGSTGNIGALVGLRKIPEILISSTESVDATFGINNCSDTVLSANLTNGETVYYGKIIQTDTNITCRNMSFNVTAPQTTGAAWFSVTNGKLIFDNCTTPTGKMKYIARGKNGAIIFENNTIASGAEISVGTKDAGQAALIVTV